MSFKPFLALSAAAGSGKTFALTVRYLSLLFAGVSPAQILAATFTKKAVAEMRERVAKVLRHLHEPDFAPYVERIVVQTGLDEAQLLQRREAVLKAFLHEHNHIVTIDSFFTSVLRAGAPLLGLDSDFGVEHLDQKRLEQLFLDEVKAAGALSTLVKMMTHLEKGKVDTLIDLLHRLYLSEPLITTEMPEASYPYALEEKIARVQQEIHERLDATGASNRAKNNFSGHETKALFERGVFSNTSLVEVRDYKKYVAKDPMIETRYQEIRALLKAWALQREAYFLHRLMQLYTFYKNARIAYIKRYGTVSFDDILHLSYRALYLSEDRYFLHFRLDEHFQHLLLDEFQDTSTLQFLLLEPLLEEIFAGKGQHASHSFFYVGDTKQSIYRFRGGNEALFDAVAKRHGVEIEPMDTNYRSAKCIVDFVNRTFEGVMEGYVKQKANGYMHEGEAVEGYLKVCEDDAPIARAVEEAKRLLQAGVAAEEIAFLVHTNKESKQLHEACIEAGIPVLLKSSTKLHKLPRIAALVAMLSYLFYGERVDAQAFCERIGKPLEALDLSWFSPTMAPVEALDRLVRDYGYAAEDPNLLRLMNIAASYTEIPAFLEAFEKSDTDVAEGSVRGATIMTIHGSKGLEFAYTIVLDRVGKGGGDSDPLLFRYKDALYVDRLFWRMKKRENHDRDYAELLDQRRALSEKERLNTLYVALTRAVKGLVVVMKPDASVFAPLALAPTEEGSIHAKRHEQHTHEMTAIALKHYGMQERADKDDEEESGFFEAQRFGTALHYALEMLPRFDAEGVKEAIAAMRYRYGVILGEEKVAQIEKRLHRMLETAPFMALLQGATLYKEHTLVYHEALYRIDLLLEHATHYVVIDYKSGRFDEAKYRTQVKHYTEAITALTGKSAEGYLLYLEASGVTLEKV